MSSVIGNSARQKHFVLLGWNLDSLLHAELSPGLEIISLFEPIYPDLERIKSIIDTNRKRNLCKLNCCFGLPAYWINPQIARELINKCMPLQSEKNGMARGIPEHQLITLDGMLINRYQEIKASVTIPPLALALNNRRKSLTSTHTIENFID